MKKYTFNIKEGSLFGIEAEIDELLISAVGVGPRVVLKDDEYRYMIDAVKPTDYDPSENMNITIHAKITGWEEIDGKLIASKMKLRKLIIKLE